MSRLTGKKASKKDLGLTKGDVLEVLETWSKMETFSASVQRIMSTKTKQLDEEIKMVRSEMAAIKDQLVKLRATESAKKREKTADSAIKRQEDKEKTERLLILRITGLPEDPVQAKNKLLQLARDNMTVALTPTDFSISTTKGRTGQATQIAKFVSIWKRREVYQARARLQGTGIYLSEHLDRPQQEIFFKCRLLRKAGVITGVWTRDLDIFVKTSSDAPPRKVLSMGDIEDLQQNVNEQKEEEPTAERAVPSTSKTEDNGPSRPASKSTSYASVKSCEFSGFKDTEVDNAIAELETKLNQLKQSRL